MLSLIFIMYQVTCVFNSRYSVDTFFFSITVVDAWNQPINFFAHFFQM